LSKQLNAETPLAWTTSIHAIHAIHAIQAPKAWAVSRPG
jgi:hypothetical protein